MNNIKCFLIEITDKFHIEKCRDPLCKIPDCWISKSPIYRRVDTGEEKPIHEFGPGAMWYADWYKDLEGYSGPDGRTLFCAVPDKDGKHHWCIDGRASNCTMKEDTIHKCWIRHGSPPNITVDKNGNTCSAGAGSIQTDGWHGFLRNGHLETC